MARKTKSVEPRSSLKLWGAIRVWAWMFILSALALAGVSVWRATGLFELGDVYMTENDIFGHAPLQDLAYLGVIALFVLAYVVCVILVLKWYLRSVRNGQVLTRGMETRPRWAVWYFIIPILSLFRPYSMTSELWRSSLKPEGWKALPDPAMLRWWWGLVLVGGIISNIANVFSRNAMSAELLAQVDVAMAVSLLLQVAAGLLFLKIGGPVSRRQSALIEDGYRPPAPTIPAWSA